MADFDINVTGTIADDSVTNAKLAPVPDSTLLGGAVSAGTTNPTNLTPDIASQVLDLATDPFVRSSVANSAYQPLDSDLTAYANAANAAARRVLIDLGNVPNVDATNPANITQDATHRFTTDAEKATWNALIGGSVFQTVWNATTNSPSLVSSTGTKGHYYIVNVAGSTNLDGITDWKVGDWAIFDGTVWRKVDNTDAVASVNGLTGAVVLDTSNVADTSNKRYVTDAQLVVIGNTSGTNSGDETTTTIGSLINGATSKTTPVDADELPLVDSAASNVLKKLSWANVKATLKTYFDTLYQTIITFGTGVQTALGVNVGTAGAFVVNGGALGTPSSGSASNLTGTTAAAGTSNTNLSTNAFVQQELALQNPSFLTYSGGSQAYAVTTLAAVNSTTFTFPSTGLYHVQYAIKHDANATTTGANFSVAGTAVFDYLNFLVSYRVDGSTAGRSSYTGLAFSLSGSAGLPAQSSAATTNNRVMVDVWINVTTVGTISLLAASEVAVASGITVTDVKGFMKKESN